MYHEFMIRDYMTVLEVLEELNLQVDDRDFLRTTGRVPSLIGYVKGIDGESSYRLGVLTTYEGTVEPEGSAVMIALEEQGYPLYRIKAQFGDGPFLTVPLSYQLAAKGLSNGKS